MSIIETPRTKDIGGVPHFRCPHCRTYKQRPAFGKARAKSHGITAWCKVCIGRAAREKAQETAAGRAEWRKGAEIRFCVKRKWLRERGKSGAAAAAGGWDQGDSKPGTGQT